MKIVFLISDDYVWAPKVLHRFLQRCKDHEVAGIVGVPGTSNHRHFFSFVFIYLKLLYPWLFLRRTLQSLKNRFIASRGKSLASIRQVAAFYEVPYRRFPDINDAATLAWISALSPDILFSIQPQYIRKTLQTLAPFGINIHPAKLPAYRGPAPIFWVLYHEEKETAISAHFINEEFDAGDIVYQEKIPISKSETYFSLGEKITEAMPKVLLETVKVLEQGGPYQPNRAFPGCYQSYPPFRLTLQFHMRQAIKGIKRLLGTHEMNKEKIARVFE